MPCSKMTPETKKLGVLCTVGELGEYGMAKKGERNLQEFHCSFVFNMHLPNYANDIHYALGI